MLLTFVTFTFNFSHLYFRFISFSNISQMATGAENVTIAIILEILCALLFDVFTFYFGLFKICKVKAVLSLTANISKIVTHVINFTIGSK